jgi:hypothetical protein
MQDGLVVRTKCCKYLKPGSIPGCAERFLMSGIVVLTKINFTQDEKE